MSAPGTSTTTAERGTEDPGTKDRGITAPRTETSSVSKTRAPHADALRQFVQLLEKGPESVGSAPPRLSLPAPLYRDMLERLGAMEDDDKEHGLVFGYLPPGYTYGSVYVEGSEDQIDYTLARASWPGLRILGLFHTHPPSYGIGDQGSTGVRGGGHSGNDLANFFRRSERASVVGTYFQRDDYRVRVLYFLLKPQTFTIPGSPQRVGDLYQHRWRARVEAGTDINVASREELSRLASEGAFACYWAENSSVLVKS